MDKEAALKVFMGNMTLIEKNGTYSEEDMKQK